MRYLSKLLGVAAALSLLALPAAIAKTVTLDVYYAFPSFAKFYEPLAQDFMKAHPEIKIKFRAPAASYDDAEQTMLRQAITNNLPDVNFCGYHLLGELVRKLQPRGQIVDLGKFMNAEPAAWREKNYADNILDLGKIDGKLYGLPFNASMPIMYYNVDLVKKAGGDPDHMPTDWQGTMKLAVKIKQLGSNIAGLAYSVNDWPDEWLWDAMLMQDGGKLVDKDGKVAFGGATGLKAVKYFRQFVTEAGMPVINVKQARQSFTAGQTGIFFDTTARNTVIGQLIGDHFKLGTAVFPIDNKENGGLPTGGNAAVITTKDPATQKAAWEFLKFMTGPEAQAVVVKNTGYMPTNKIAAGSDYLGPFYKDHPHYQTVLKEIDRSRPWPGYPSGNNVRIWRAQRDIIGSIMRGDISPADGLKQIVQTTESLMAE